MPPHASAHPEDAALIILNGDHVQIVGSDGVARALAGSLPPGLGWPGGTIALAPADALALGGVAGPALPYPPPSSSSPPHHPGAVLRADGGVAFALYLAIGFASTLACIATLVGAFYVARALAARTAADAAAAAAAAARDEEEGGRPPPKPTVVVVHPGGAAVGVGVEECVSSATGVAVDGEEEAAPPKRSPGKGDRFCPGLPTTKPAAASPASLAVAALPCDDGGLPGGPPPPADPALIPARCARPHSPAAAAVAAVTAAVSAAASAAAAAAGVGGGEGGGGGQAPPNPPADHGFLRRLRGLMLARAPSPPPPAGEP